ncbi:hypothetical protein [endosymbiont GvMRE of Glomus versiforme]|uniref:hypothetical protein n=1 Tax=endosymbiont GvMRE of Glomus versiforme TaxID=2039283 RepID=UPI000EBB3604|nr:hypothetical protein [endosymbiont GvMRE of Glomus versiforme]RHZ35255.1 hypothetical protein GvMRE_IIg70 [endosymbiont GvMRE of Glomus versiforme]
MKQNLNNFNKEFDKILSIDPSGTGTTGIYFRNGEVEEFLQYQGKDWKEHYKFIQQLVRDYQPNILLFEDTNYIHKRTKDGLNLFRLLGAIECLEVKQIEKVNVLRVKELTKKMLVEAKHQNLNKMSVTYQIKDLDCKTQKLLSWVEYKVGRGKGWMYKNKRVSIHCLESYLVYWLSKISNNY